MYGVINFSVIDTTPGAQSAFGPPPGWEGNYVELMRERWKKDPGVRQHVFIVGRMLYRDEEVEFIGPFATEAKAIVESAYQQ
jgi:hypothetical protein